MLISLSCGLFYLGNVIYKLFLFLYLYCQLFSSKLLNLFHFRSVLGNIVKIIPKHQRLGKVNWISFLQLQITYCIRGKFPPLLSYFVHNFLSRILISKLSMFCNYLRRQISLSFPLGMQLCFFGILCQHCQWCWLCGYFGFLRQGCGVSVILDWYIHWHWCVLSL